MSTIQNAVATQQQNSPAHMVEQYRGEFAQVLPSHIKPETWVRVAVGSLRSDPKLREAAGNDVGALMGALMEAARKGLEPGTEEFYLVPRKQKGVLKVQGIEGYRGIIERMYRAGAIASVIVEVVREGDTFRYAPGRDERPVHEVDWFGDDRGKLKGVYAYAVMKDGATSKVVVLNRAQVMEAKAKSDGASSQYSPWNTSEESMWLKTAARRLEKWVPTSAEYIREQMRAARDVLAEPVGTTTLPTPEPAHDPETGEVVEGEVVDENNPWGTEPA